MPARRTLAVYLLLFALTAAIMGMLARVVPWAYASWGCAVRQPPGTFIATCLSDVFGDYERGAYHYNLEGEAVENLRKAQVVVLGSSRAQFAFSTDEVRSYFSKRQVPYYVFGFAQGDARLAAALIARHGVKPKLLIVAPDPFFASDRQEAIWVPDGELARWEAVRRRFEYRSKKALQAVAPALCRWSSRLCARPIRVVYRASRDGMWEWRDYFLPAEFQSIPVPPPAVLQPTGEARAQVEPPRAFLAGVGVRAGCLVLTATPDVQYLTTLNERFVADLAGALGATAIQPRLDGLTTIDTTHLTWSSAQRWSAAFLAELDPVLKRCLP